MLPPRQDTWERRLVEWADAQRGAALTWGENDCAALALAAVHVLVGDGTITLDDLMPSYDTSVGAVLAMTTLLETYDSLGAALEAHGLEAAGRLTYAQHGDLAVWEPDDENPLPTIGIVVGRSVLLVDEVAERVGMTELSVLLFDERVTIYRVP